MSKDLFVPILPTERLNPNYDLVRTSAGSEPARMMMNDVFSRFPNPDGNFVEQFQTTGFDSRTFELYLYAYLADAGFGVRRDFERPDFIVSRNGMLAAIEVTTANPSKPAGRLYTLDDLQDLPPGELKQKLQEELPIRRSARPLASG